MKRKNSLSAAKNILSESFNRALKDFGPFEPNPTFAVALSGGSDSLALLFLLKNWTDQNGGSVVALHVDHQLRERSGEESSQVKGWCQKEGIKCVVLPWEHENIRTCLHERAREARYRLLTAYCKNHAILHLFFGHHQEDQEETFLYRLSRKSGADGLCAMAAVEDHPHVRILRPLLQSKKGDLVSFLGDHPFLEDPSNKSDSFWRGHYRNLGSFPIKDFSLSIEKLSSVRRFLEETIAKVLLTHITVYAQGYVVMGEGLLKEPQEIRHRALERVLTMMGGHGYPVRHDSIRRVLEVLERRQNATLAGCILQWKKGALMILREPRAVEGEVLIDPGEVVSWDNRFVVDASESDQPLVCRVITEREWPTFKDNLKEKRLPHIIYRTLPVFFTREGELVFFPFGDLKIPHKMIKSPKVFFRPRSSLMRSLRFLRGD